jgi:hypothetical protein
MNIRSVLSRSALMLLALLSFACAPLPLTPQDVQAKRIESTPGKAVIYVVRTRPDLSYLPSTITLDDQMLGTTHAGTYFRVEVQPGRHQLAGYGQDTGAITLDVQADRIYFVQQTVAGSWRTPSPHSFFRIISENEGRATVARGVLAG